MPHLTLEYTNNLSGFDTRHALSELNRVLTATGHFEEIDIKSRAIPLDTHVVGTQKAARAFVHAKLALLSGRSVDVKRDISERLLRELKELCHAPVGVHLQLCVEILEIERESYTKTSIEP